MTAVDEYPEPDLADVDIAQCAERYRWHLEAAQLAFHGAPEESRWGCSPGLGRAAQHC